MKPAFEISVHGLHRLGLRPRAQDLGVQPQAVQQGSVTHQVGGGDRLICATKDFPPMKAVFCRWNGLLRSYCRSLKTDDKRGTGFRAGLLLDDEQHSRCGLHRTAKTKPRSERNAAHAFCGNVGKVEYDHAEASPLQEQVGDLQDLLETAKRKTTALVAVAIVAQGSDATLAATHPQQAIEIDTCCSGRNRIEGVAGIDQRAGFFTAHGFGKRGEHDAGAPGGSGAGNFAERSARESSGERVERGHAGGDSEWRGFFAQQQRGG